MSTLYTATATATGEGRAGRAVSDDGQLDLALAIPAALGGPGGGTNPEQLFAAGWAACFHSALRTVARAEKTTLADTSVIADVSLLPDGNGGYKLQAALHVEIGGMEQAVAEQLVERAHQVCPYSNATRGNIDVVIDTTVG